MNDDRRKEIEAQCETRAVQPHLVRELLAELDRLQRQVGHANEKWRDYEQNYILPCFKWAEEAGFDLRQLVSDNPGKNCVVLYSERLRAENAELRRVAVELYAALVGGPKENEWRPVRCTAPTGETVPNECECYACASLRHYHVKQAALAKAAPLLEPKG